MAMSPVSSNTPIHAPTKATPPESTEATVGGKDLKSDGDADDKGAASAKASAPVVNTLGQQLGRNLNVTA